MAQLACTFYSRTLVRLHIVESSHAKAQNVLLYREDSSRHSFPSDARFVSIKLLVVPEATPAYIPCFVGAALVVKGKATDKERMPGHKLVRSSTG